jgi:hypothetical protein
MRDSEGDLSIMLFTSYDLESGLLTVSVYTYDQDGGLRLLQYDEKAGMLKVRTKGEK